MMKDQKELQKQPLSSEIESLCKRLHLLYMLDNYRAKSQEPQWMSQGFEYKIASLLRDEAVRRNANAVHRLRKESNLPAELANARFADLVDSPQRKIDANVLAVIRDGSWMVRDKPGDLVITGATGVGKSFVAACCANWYIDRRQSVYFIRSARLFQDLELCSLTHNLEQRKAEIKKVGLLVIDDFLLETMDEQQVSNLLDVVNDRVHHHPTIYTSQYTLDGWLDRLGNTPLTQSVLDRIAHSAYWLHIDGPSMRQSVS